jgi:hypothetical protein
MCAMGFRFVSRLASTVALLVVLLGGSLAASAAGAGAVAQSTRLVFKATADAAVKSVYPSKNFGTSLVLRARTSPAVHSYLRFDVSGLNGATILAARLRLYARSGSSQAVNVKAVASDTWGETTITYSNAPAIGTTIGNSPASFTSGTWVTVDVSSYVKQAGVYSFALTAPSGSPVDFSSRETGAAAPRLVLILASSTTPTPTATSDWQPSFPIRAAFYYPWFPEAWKQQGIYPYTNYTPQLGYYSSTDASILKQHIAMMQYGNIQAGIASWWGQGSQTDTKIAGLLKAAGGTKFRWALYYEMESHGDPSASQIQSDLAYIRDHYSRDPSFLRVNGKFVVFVYADGADACGMADRWKQANTVNAYVVLKVFPGYSSCASQPNNWHQYAPALAASQQANHSYSISPGFWLVGNNMRLSRDVTRWQKNVRDMVASGARWQLVTTFSEWGEGTAVEPAKQWASGSGYGQYLDALHYNGNMP